MNRDLYGHCGGVCGGSSGGLRSKRHSIGQGKRIWAGGAGMRRVSTKAQRSEGRIEGACNRQRQERRPPEHLSIFKSAESRRIPHRNVLYWLQVRGQVDPEKTIQVQVAVSTAATSSKFPRTAPIYLRRAEVESLRLHRIPCTYKGCAAAAAGGQNGGARANRRIAKTRRQSLVDRPRRAALPPCLQHPVRRHAREALRLSVRPQRWVYASQPRGPVPAAHVLCHNR